MLIYSSACHFIGHKFGFIKPKIMSPNKYSIKHVDIIRHRLMHANINVMNDILFYLVFSDNLTYGDMNCQMMDCR